MSDIVEFLTARLDEDEAYALNAAESVSRGWFEPFSGAVQFGGPEDNPECEMALTYDSGISRHMVRHDPARVLAEVKAKRAIGKAQQDFAARVANASYKGYDALNYHRDRGTEAALMGTLRYLAAPYADHPDYQQAWSVNLT